MPDFIAELKWRGLFHQCTNEEGLRAHLAGGPRRAYIGFDPTSDSLTIGNLVQIMVLRHFQRSGHQPVVVMGGGTGLIGDPSGKSAERQLLSREQVEANVNAQRRIFERLLDFTEPPPHSGRAGPAMLVNNYVWLRELSYLDVLRDVGKHFSVNAMIQKDSVRERLTNRDQGISYTEFSYMILQAYDFLYLHEHQGVTLQMGGSDQWGNIVGGADLVRRRMASFEEEILRLRGDPGDDAARRRTAERIEVLDRKRRSFASQEAFGLTAPLVTKADGGKFGKTESGAVWLTRDRTSPYAYYQFWLNAADADAPRFLRFFTLLEQDQIAALEAAHTRDPGARELHRTLAREATTLLHGAAEADLAERAARALFSGEIADLPEATLAEALASAPGTDHDKALLGAGVPLLDLLPQTSLAKSKSEAREFLASGSVSVNGVKAAHDRKLIASDLLHGKLIALRRGKKSWHLTRWQ
jgi:tyrosyl-tRNA synthetase